MNVILSDITYTACAEGGGLSCRGGSPAGGQRKYGSREFALVSSIIPFILWDCSDWEGEMIRQGFPKWGVGSFWVARSSCRGSELHKGIKNFSVLLFMPQWSYRSMFLFCFSSKRIVLFYKLFWSVSCIQRDRDLIFSAFACLHFTSTYINI